MIGELKFNSNLLIVARIARQLSQTDLATKLELSGNTISKWEIGSQIPKANQIGLLCEVLAITPNFLFGCSSFSELDIPE